MKFTLNPFALWRQIQYYEKFIKRDCKLLGHCTKYIRELIEESLVKDRMIKRLETDLKIANDKLKVNELAIEAMKK